MVSLERIQRCVILLGTLPYSTQSIQLKSELTSIGEVLSQCKMEIVALLRDLYFFVCDGNHPGSNAYIMSERELIAEITRWANTSVYQPELSTISSTENSLDFNLLDNSPPSLSFPQESPLEPFNLPDSTDYTFQSDLWDSPPSTRFPNIAIPRITYPITQTFQQPVKNAISSPNSPFAATVKPPDFESFRIDGKPERNAHMPKTTRKRVASDIHVPCRNERKTKSMRARM